MIPTLPTISRIYSGIPKSYQFVEVWLAPQNNQQIGLDRTVEILEMLSLYHSVLRY